MANAKSIYMESTTVSVAKSVSDIIALLARTPGVRQVSQSFDPKALGRIESISFVVDLEGLSQVYTLRADVESVKRQRRRMAPNAKEYPDERFERIAWRQVHEWVNVQIAMIEGGQLAPSVAFMAYLTQNDGRTLGQWYLDGGHKQLRLSEAADHD